jgi:hypothetical protein
MVVWRHGGLVSLRLLGHSLIVVSIVAVVRKRQVFK